MVCAMLSGASEVCPVAGAAAPASPAAQPAGATAPEQGLSARTAFRSFWKMESV